MRVHWKYALAALALGAVPGGAALAQAPDLRLLGFNTALTATCNVGCSQLTIGLALTGLRPTDNMGQPVPAGIAALGMYIRNTTLQIYGTNPTITGVAGVPATFTQTIDNGPTNFAALVLTHVALPLTSSSLAFTVDLAAGAGVVAVSASGLGYIDANLAYHTASGAVQPVPPPLPPPPGGPFYQTGDFNAFVSPVTEIVTNAVPEPSTYVLMATGLVALGGLARRRRDA